MNMHVGRARVDGAVTREITAFKFVPRDMLYAQAGFADERLALSHALMYSTAYKVLDKSHSQVAAHYNDGAYRANVRYQQSRVRFSAQDIIGSEHHDIPEDMGRKIAEIALHDTKYTLAAALLLIENTHRLLHQRTGVDFNTLLPIMTNMGELVFEPALKPLEKKFVPTTPDYNKSAVISALDRTYAGFKVDEATIKKVYGWMVEKWAYVRNNSLMGADYLPDSERNFWTDTLDGFINETKKRVDNDDLPEPAGIDKLVLEKVATVRGILDSEMPQFDRRLLLPHQHPRQSGILNDLKFAVYFQSYIAPMFYEFAQEAGRAAQSGIRYNDPSLEGNPRLSAPRLKQLEQSDVLTRMNDLDLDGRISVIRKDMGIIKEAIRTGSAVRSIGGPYQLIWPSTRFLYRELGREIEGQLGEATRGAAHQTRLEEEVEAFNYLSEKLREVRLPKKPALPNTSLVDRLANAATTRIFF